MEKIYNKVLQEEIYFDKLSNGLSVYYMPKKSFTKKYAILATNYGSNELEFVPIGEKERFKVNLGVAHFLEHKMFEQPGDKNAFEEFSKYGASANAFTNFTMTAYLFSATDNFYESLAHLVDYVETPYFTDENVEKEKGIIEQEIKMYNDDPGWNAYFNCIRAMYVNYPVRNDIAGTVESIYKITKEELYKCYNTFYNPGNMSLFVVGDLDLDKIMDTVKKANHYDVDHLNGEIKKFYPEEPEHIFQKEIVKKFPISIPMFYIGFKDANVGIKGRELLKKEVISDILLEMVFGKGSKLYEDLYDRGLINENFGAGFLSEVNYGFSLIAGDSKDPKKVQQTIFNYLNEFKQNGLCKEDFNRIKTKNTGSILKSFDTISDIANSFISNNFKGINILDYVDVIKEVTFDEVQNRLNDHLKEETCVVSIVEPNE